jgi:WD40 repeat protein/serine/threonine protein kinase
MADQPKTVKESPPAEPTADILRSEAYETANVVAPTASETNPVFGDPKSPDEIGTLGPYRVLRELGRGGMGAVYLGFDERLKRKVALKVMLPKYAAVASSKNRFLREARAAAGITHDHIVTIYEADEHAGTPYMAMQLLQGYPLDVYLKKHPKLSLGELLRIGREMALGLAAAHSVGLVHRDIKPGNIWLEAPNGRVKILDFGLAKPTEDQKVDGELTATGVIVGTPAYMPPEQARGAKADFRADLFSLGVVLYRLATGTMPFRGDTMMAMLAAVIADDPQPVGDINPEIPEPFAKLIHQLMEKKPQNRPNSADEVAERLRQIELGTAAAISLPMQVIPLDALPSTTYTAPGTDPFAELDTEPNEVVTRHKTTSSMPALPAAAKKSIPKWPLVALGFFLVVLAVLIPQIVLIMTPKGTLVIESSDPDVEITVKQGGAVLLDKSKQREFTLKVGDDYTIEMTEKDGLKLNVNKFEITRNNKTTVKVIVQRPPPKPKVDPPTPAIPSAAPIVPLAWQGPSPLDALDPAAIPAAEKFDWQPKELVGVLGSHAARHWGRGTSLAVSPDGKVVATGGSDAIRLWDATTLRPLGEIGGLNNTVNRIAFSQDGKQILTLVGAATGWAEFVLCDIPKKSIVDRWAPMEKDQHIQGIPFFAPDGRLLAATYDAAKYAGVVRILNIKTGSLVVELKGHPANGYIWTALSPDGTRFATLHSGHVQLWDAKTGNRLNSWNEMKPGGDNWLAFSPDGKWIAASSGGPSPEIDLHLWDVASGQSALVVKNAISNYGMSLAFSRDGTRLVIGGDGGPQFHVVELPSGKTICKIDNQAGYREAIINADASRVVTFGTHYGAGGDGMLHSYDTKTGAPIDPATDRVASLLSVAFSPDLKNVITQDLQDRLRVWNTASGQSGKPIELSPLGIYSIRKVLPFPIGRRAVVLEKSTTIRDLTTGEVLQDLNTLLAITADLSPDGKLLALGMRDESLELWNVAAMPAVRVGSVSTDGHANGTVRFSPDGQRLATEGLNAAAIWDVSAGAPKKLYDLAVTGTPYAIVWAPDGRSVALVQGANLSFWSLDAKVARKLPHEVQTDGEYFTNQTLAYHPTGKWVAVIGQKSGKVFLYNPADGTLAKSWQFPVPPADLAFAADGRHLAVANPNGTVYILRLEGAAASPMPLVPLAWNGPSPFDALDGAKLPESLRFETMPKELVGQFGSADARHWGEGMCLAVSPDGKHIATGGSDKLIRVWNADTIKSPLGPLAGHTRPIIALQFSPDGQKLLSAGDTAEMKIRLWDVRSGQLLDTMEMQIDGRTNTGLPFFGRNGQPLVAVMNANDAGHVLIYDLSNKAILHKLAGHEPKGMCMTAISRDSTKLATNDGKAVRLWNAIDGKLLHEWNVINRNNSYCVQFSPDGQYVAAPSDKADKYFVNAWDTTTYQPVLQDKPIASGQILSLAFSRDGKRALAGGRTNGYDVFEFPSGKDVCRIAPTGHYGEAVFNSSGSHVVSFGSMYLNGGDGVLRIYDAKTGQPAIPLPTGPTGPITSMALSNDLTQLFTVGADSTVRVWDTRTLQATTAYETTPQTYSTPRMALLPDGKRLVVVEKSVVIRDRSTGALLETLSPETAGSVVISPDGRTVVFGTQTGKIEAYDITAIPAKKLWDYSAHDAAVHSVAFSPDGRRLASGGNDHHAFIWDVTGKEPKKLCEAGAGGIPAGDENVYRIVWMPDGKSLMITRGQRVQVWRVSDKTAVLQDSFVVAGGGTYLSKGMSLHPSLPWVAIAAGKDRGAVALWNYATKTKLKEWDFPAAPTALEFAADGRHLLTANPNGTVGVLRLDVPKPPADPERAAAVWAIGLKGEVHILSGGTVRIVKTTADLPNAAFSTLRIELPRGAPVTDADVVKNIPDKNLLVAILTGTPVGDETANHLATIPTLTDVHLAVTKVTDAGAIKLLTSLPKLRLLNLANTEVKGLLNASLDRHPILEDINLHNTAAGDDTVRSLAKCPKLATLHLSSTKVTDAGLAALEACPSLQYLTLGKTAVTDAGVKKLAAALPLCKIEWDGGTIEPKSAADRNRAAAEWLLAQGANIGFNTPTGFRAIEGRNGDKLPDGDIVLKSFVLGASFQAESELARIRSLESLDTIVLSNSGVGDGAVEHLLTLPTLTKLYLSGTKLTDRGLKALENSRKLDTLHLNQTTVTESGVKAFAAKFPKCEIEWNGAQINPKTVGLGFDGKSTYVKIPTALGGNVFPYTIEAWITPQSVTGKSRHLFLFGEPGGGMGLSEKGNLGIGFKTPREWVSDYGRSVLKPGERVHVAAVATAKQFELFLNGRSDGIKPVQIRSLVGISPPALIGKHTKDAPEGYFHGTIHAMRVSKSARYTKPFTPDLAWKPDTDTIAQYHFDEGTGTKLTDHSGNGHHGVIENGTWAK